MFINPCLGIITSETEHTKFVHVSESRFREVFACWIREFFSCGNRNPELGIRKTAQEIRIQQTIGIQNPSSADKDSGIHYLESGIHGMESRIQDCPRFPYMERGDAQSTSSHPHLRKGREEGGKLRKNASHNYIENISQSKKRLKGGNKEIPYWWVSLHRSG